jgi:uncharacterized membrane protein YoaT (DUF817 family)
MVVPEKNHIALLWCSHAGCSARIFFTHHYIGDYRWYIAACALALSQPDWRLGHRTHRQLKIAGTESWFAVVARGAGVSWP